MRDRVVLGLGLAIAASVAGIYYPVHDHELVALGELERVLQSPAFREGFGWDSVVGAFTRPFQGAWVPLTALSLHLDARLYGSDAGGYLLTNVVLHAAGALLLLAALVRMTGARWCSGFVALFFAVHPLHVESVAWIAERGDVLSGLFFMGALLAYARYAQGRPTLRRMLPVAGLLAAGLLAKPMLVTLPLVLLLLDYWPLRRTGLEKASPPDAARLRALVVEKWPLFALAAVLGVVTLRVHDATATVALVEIPLSDRIANALSSVAIYLSQTVLPQGLAMPYPYPAEADWQAAGAAALLILGASVFAVRLGREQPYLIVGWLWFLGMLAPVIGLVPLGPHAHADRYLYLPQTGLAIAFAWGAADVVVRTPALRPAFVVVATLLLGRFAGLAWVQTGYWRDDVALYERAIAVTEENHLAHTELGEALLARGRPLEALLQFEQARRLRPGGREVELGLADALVQSGQVEPALPIYERWIAARPDDPRPLVSRGIAQLQRGRIEQAHGDFERALALDPGLAEAHAGLAIVLDAVGRSRESVAANREALRLDPSLFTAANNLAWTLATSSDPALRNPPEAVRLAERATQTRPTDPSALDTLAVAYAAAGRFEEAVAAGERALAQAEQLGAADLALQLEARLADYRAGRAGSP